MFVKVVVVIDLFGLFFGLDRLRIIKDELYLFILNYLIVNFLYYLKNKCG